MNPLSEIRKSICTMVGKRGVVVFTAQVVSVDDECCTVSTIFSFFLRYVAV